MDISSLESIILICIFLLPGYIIAEVSNCFCKQPIKSNTNDILKKISYSIINLAVFSWLYLIVYNNYNLNIEFWFFCSLISILSSVILGAIIGFTKQNSLLRDFLANRGIITLDSMTTAWDYKFSNTETCWVKVTLLDNSIVSGYFSNKSFASHDYNDRDIFIENTYAINDESEWKKEKKTDGILVLSSNIKHIEFIKNTTEED